MNILDVRREITWTEVFLRCEKIAKEIRFDDFVYPVPRGALYFVSYLKKLTGCEIVEKPEQATIFVDDIIASGRTKEKYLNINSKAKFLALFDTKEYNNQWIIFPWERYTKKETIEDNLIRILEFIGEDVNREGLKETPERMVKAFEEIFAGYKQNPKEFVKTFEDGACDEMVICKDINFFSICEHHFLPFYGKISIAYIPNRKVIGVSKLIRIAECFAKRLQIQERLTTQIADFLYQELEAKGVMVLCEAEHLCMKMRGVRSQDSKMITSAIRGAFEKQEVRQEFLNLVK